MKHLLLWLFACLLTSSAVAAKPAWVDPDIIRAYEWATGKNYADEIAKLTGAELPPSGALESPRIGSDSSKSKAMRDKTVPRGIVRLTDSEKLIRAYITLGGGGANLGSLDLRIDRWVNDSQGTITFPADMLPQVSVLKGVKELYLGGVQEAPMPDLRTLTDSSTTPKEHNTDAATSHQSFGTLTVPKEAKRADYKPAWVDPDIIRAYEKVTGKSYTEEVAKLTGAKSTTSPTLKSGEYDGHEKTASAEEFDYRSVPGVVEHNDGIYLHVHLKFDGDVRELESLDPRIYVNRMGDKVSRAGNVITVRFPIEFLPMVSRLGGVKRVYSSKLKGPQLNYSAPIVKGYYANIDSTHHVSGSDVMICRPQNCF
jgi:hypothetical protein